MKRYLTVLLLLTTVGTIIQKLIIAPQFPESNFSVMISIPLFYLLLGLSSIVLLHFKPEPSIAIILGIKTAKIIFTLTFILVYASSKNEDINVFLFSILAYFVTYLIFETWMLSTMNKKTRFNNE